jgi:hypothetical protein
MTVGTPPKSKCMTVGTPPKSKYITVGTPPKTFWGCSNSDVF